MRYLTIILAAGAFWLASCGNNEAPKEAATETPKTPESKLDEAGTAKLMHMVSDYYTLKDALVATDAAQADKAADQLKTSADTMIAYISNDSVNGATLRPYLDTMVANTGSIRGIMDEGCEQKRVYFEKVSDAMFALLKNAGLKNAGIYRQYCPMAFNEKGAYWLSNVTDIKNPYFGRKMLECGEVTDSLK